MGSRGVGLGKTGKTVKLSQPKGKALGQKFVQGMEDVLNKNGTDLAKQVFSKFLGAMTFGGDIPAKSAHYSPKNDQVHFNPSEVARGNNVQKPYETAFHEFGHALDHTKHNMFGTVFHSMKLGIPKMLSAEFSSYKKKMGFKSDLEAFNHFNSKYSKITRATLSDALECVTGKDTPLGAGHGAKYHKNSLLAGTEFFANTLATQASNPDGYKLLKKVFPKSVATVENTVKDILKNY